ncbi:glycerophosphodiester phosphodiesterase [Nocardioides sp. QY071]|uniref:glycerophosphodiester phosphodiesterase n=1 Tax=Nocardioides sp. QY071 TaxID=3044187 RepID=UPI00249A02D6|nr:glycerophosphodiester phosphodiesterase [Nocardioides sp. QY071]WGY00751.1 glycerophosphodiester phosphodiesterase [Nocardioides sp. QY071]
MAAITTAVVALGAAAVPVQAAPGNGHPDRHPGAEPIVIAHRGASGYRPEHTLAAYRLAIEMGADYVEPDLVSTKDGVLVARHENEISGTTDVATHPEFAGRRTTRTIDGVSVTGWFTEDFTLAELKTLRAKERLPQVRPDNTRYDGRFEIPTLEEVIRLVKRESGRTGRTIGIAPETKHPSYFDSIGLSLEEPLVRTLRRNGLDRPNAKVVIQSFETANLRQLDTMTRVPLAQLVDGSGAPYDLKAAGSTTTYADLVRPAGLADIATYADWVAPTKSLVIPRDASGAIGAPSSLVADAHAVGLRVVTWTMRVENQFLPTDHRIGTDPNAKGDLAGEVDAFLDAGVDALFSDNPDIAVATRDGWLAGEGAA